MRDSNLVLGCLLSAMTLLNAYAADVFTVAYPASTNQGEFALESKFHVWLPPPAKRIRAVIVHQHGCGEGAESFGDRAALDLHWRALAAKHDAALLSPHYRAGGDCRAWYEPRKGSGAMLERALADLARETGHPELAEAPWCLWGHSGGGVWVSLMLELYPERIVAAFCRSGAAAGLDQMPDPQFPPAAYVVPVIFNSGLGERDTPLVWDNPMQFFRQFRARGAPVAFAPDPISKHDCRNSRLLAIPFFDACLEARLPRRGHELKPLKPGSGWSGDWERGTVERAREIPASLSWLPNQGTARAFADYVTTGITIDRTPPPSAPVITSVIRAHNGVAVAWTAEADLESGILQFAIYREGKRIALWPVEFDEQTGYHQFQGISFHDTPVSRRPPMAFTDRHVSVDARPAYSVATINGSGLEGPRSKPVRP